MNGSGWGRWIQHTGTGAQPRARLRFHSEKGREVLRIAAVSFVFGSLIVGLLLLCFAFGLAIIADTRGWDSFGIGSGVLIIFDYKRTPGGTETVIGTGTILVALLAGALNAVAGTVRWSRMPNRR